MECTEEALDYAASQSYDHLFGARPLRRWLEHHIITPLSRKIVSGASSLSAMESGPGTNTA